jgi:hypothetical protein
VILALLAAALAAPLTTPRARGIPVDAAVAVLDAGRPARAACLAGGLDPAEPPVRLLVEADGHVSHVAVQARVSATTQACLEAQLRSLVFPPPAGGLGMVAVGGREAEGRARSLDRSPGGPPPCRVSRWAFATATPDHCAAPALDALWALVPSIRGCYAGAWQGALPVTLDVEKGVVTRVAVPWEGLTAEQRACVDRVGRTLAVPGVHARVEVDYLLSRPGR